MAVPESKETMDAMAFEIFELYRLIALARSRRPAGSEDLSETEFVTLDLLSKEGPMTIGEVQKHVGVVPAQMSRIVRALEVQGGKGYVECSINPQDRRRVDISLTDAGREAYEKFRAVRLQTMYETLSVLAPDDRLHFMRMMRQLHKAFAEKLQSD